MIKEKGKKYYHEMAVTQRGRVPHSCKPSTALAQGQHPEEEGRELEGRMGIGEGHMCLPDAF